MPGKGNFPSHKETKVPEGQMICLRSQRKSPSASPSDPKPITFPAALLLPYFATAVQMMLGAPFHAGSPTPS